MERLGTWSYSIYLNHFLLVLLIVTAVRAARKVIGEASLSTARLELGNLYAADALGLVYIALVIAISATTYRWIENPWRLRFNAWADRVQAGRTAAKREAPPTPG